MRKVRMVYLGGFGAQGEKFSVLIRRDGGLLLWCERWQRIGGNALGPSQRARLGIAQPNRRRALLLAPHCIANRRHATQFLFHRTSAARGNSYHLPRALSRWQPLPRFPVRLETETLHGCNCFRCWTRTPLLGTVTGMAEEMKVGKRLRAELVSSYGS